jgi:hypothetical protein
MPFTLQEAAMLGAGMMFAGGATFFYKRKQTLPFKLAYFMAWPTLGTAVLMAATPSREKMEERLRQRGIKQENPEISRQKTREQMEALRGAVAADETWPAPRRR